MLWEVEIHPALGQVDREGARVLSEARALRLSSITNVRAARSFLIEGEADEAAIQGRSLGLLVDSVVESCAVRQLGSRTSEGKFTSTTDHQPSTLFNVLYKPGVTDNVALSTKAALTDLTVPVSAVATCRKYWLNEGANADEVQRLIKRVLANDAIEHVIAGPLKMESIAVGNEYTFKLTRIAIREMDDDHLTRLSREGQLYLNLVEMQTIRQHFIDIDRDPTEIELETVAQTWSEHCSHKTLGGRIHYQDGRHDIYFQSMLKETIFAATVEIRRQLGDADWCVSVFKDNAGIVRFDETQNVCIKVETHNHPSAIEPYGGANTGLGGVIRDPLGTGLGAKPICNTDVFCFAPPDTPHESLPPGTLHPKLVMRGVVSGVRDYGNRMGIPTVNGAIYFDERYLGNPLVYCGNVAMIPVNKCEKQVMPGDYIVTVGGRTGRDGIHGATFSSAELTHESETISGGSVQIGNAVVEKMVADVVLQARDRGLYNAITDCGAGGFSSAVGEMGEALGAEVWLEKAPLKYAGLSYTEIWISEAQERMVLAVPPSSWPEFETLCRSEGVEAAVLGEFKSTGRLVLKYHGEQVGDLAMSFLHDGRPPIVREAVYAPQADEPLHHSVGRLSKSAEPVVLENQTAERFEKPFYDDDLKRILGSLNVCSKEWVIRQYDHEVQAGSVVKPLVGVCNDGPSDAAVVRPNLLSKRGLAVACGMNPRFGDLDPYWMAAAAIDEAVRNCVAVGADPRRIAILDNFCWGNTDRPETLGTLVRAALACKEVAIAFGTPFVSGKDSLNNEFTFTNSAGQKQTVAIPSSLLITALGQLNDVEQAVTMDLKSAGNVILLVGVTANELGGSHFALVNGLEGGAVPRLDLELAPRIFGAIHEAIRNELIRSCHDLSEGGLATAVAEMAFAGGLGLSLNLQSLAVANRLNDDVALLFSESNSRFVIEVPTASQAAVESLCNAVNVPITKLGEVTSTDRLVIQGANGAVVIDSALSDLKQCWQKPLAWN
ncbi:MAG: phosphoribosylformylglycinamidine synthase subunit PurL [Planctomycetia bacterium]|nr:phosphoribosylformylglycinamidine synthase subunit PurL [Planctomycetia bacterium]